MIFRQLIENIGQDFLKVVGLSSGITDFLSSIVCYMQLINHLMRVGGQFQTMPVKLSHLQKILLTKPPAKKSNRLILHL